MSSMLETPQYPEVARVMRVKPEEGQQPAAGYTWGDYEDADDNKVISMTTRRPTTAAGALSKAAVCLSP